MDAAAIDVVQALQDVAGQGVLPGAFANVARIVGGEEHRLIVLHRAQDHREGLPPGGLVHPGPGQGDAVDVHRRLGQRIIRNLAGQVGAPVLHREGGLGVGPVGLDQVAGEDGLEISVGEAQGRFAPQLDDQGLPWKV